MSNETSDRSIGLNAFLKRKRPAIARRIAQARQGAGPSTMGACARPLGESGIREIRIRKFQFLNDSPPDFAGFDSAPTSPELLLGALASCLVHTTLIKAADRSIAIEDVEVEVTGKLHPLAGLEGYEEIPVHPYDVGYTLTVTSNSSVATVKLLHEAVVHACPLRVLISKTQDMAFQVVHVSAADFAKRSTVDAHEC